MFGKKQKSKTVMEAGRVYGRERGTVQDDSENADSRDTINDGRGATSRTGMQLRVQEGLGSWQ